MPESAWRQNIVIFVVVCVMSVSGFLILGTAHGLWSMLMLLFVSYPTRDKADKDMDACERVERIGAEEK